MTRRAPPIGFALLFCGLASYSDGEARISAPAFGEARAGHHVVTEWNGLPNRVDELELLLTVEGRDIPLRLTPRLLPQPGLVVWRVPNILLQRARIRLRFGVEGEEVESALSAEFEIRPSESEPPAALAFRDGEWWVESAAAGRFPGTLGSAPGGDRVQENREAPPCVGTSRVPAPSAHGEVSASRSSSAKSRPRPVRAPLRRNPIEAPRRL